MKHIVFCLILLAALPALAAVSLPEQKVADQVPARPGQMLVLDLETGGSVSIRGWDKDLVSMDASLAGKDWKDCRVDLKQTPEGARLTSDHNGSRNSYSTDFHFDIRVPEKFDVRIESSGGDVKIENLLGRITGWTGGGDINIISAEGEITLTTGGGEILIVDTKADGKVSTGGGDVKFENVSGNITGASGSGIVIHSNATKTSHNDGKDGEIRIAKAGGPVEVSDAPAGIRASTGGGDIHIASAHDHLSAATGGGDIRVDAVDGDVQATTGAGDILVKVVSALHGNRHDVDLTTGEGDVTLYVPNSFSMDLDLEVAYTRGNTKCAIISEFPIQEKRTSEWDDSRGTPRKFITGTGQIGGGQNRIRIKTVNGNIYLKKIR